MRSHQVDYEILGDDMQIVEIELDPGEVVIGEADAMNYMDDGIDFEAKMGHGSAADSGLTGKLLGKMYLQCLPFSRLVERIYRHAPQRGGSKGEGSGLGELGDMLDGYS